jgi:hypothetical protein
MNEYLLIIVYVVGVLYSTFAYGFLIGSWDFDPMILVVFFWPLVLLVGPILGILLPFYFLGTKCVGCIESCGKTMELRRREREKLPPLSWKQWCIGCFTEVICCPCIFVYKVLVTCLWYLFCCWCCSCCRRKDEEKQTKPRVTTLQSKIEYKLIPPLTTPSSHELT